MYRKYRTIKRLIFMGLLTSGLLFSPKVMGETNNTEQITQERQRKSVASQETSVSGGTLMLAAYMCFWALIFGYLMYLYMGQRNIEKEQKILETKIDELSDRLIAAQEPENE